LKWPGFAWTFESNHGAPAGLALWGGEDTSNAVKVAVEALKRLIEADRKAGR